VALPWLQVFASGGLMTPENLGSVVSMVAEVVDPPAN
jgi:hypothetical protein